MNRILEINSCLLKILRRSDRNDPKQLVQTFTDTGLLYRKLSTTDHQIIYGRRGTGKTHAIKCLAEKIKEVNQLSIFIDMRNVGSEGGIYSDTSLEISDRGTRLLVETLKTVHDGIREYVHKDIENNNLGINGPLLNNLLESITQTKIIGTKKFESSYREKVSTGQQFGIKLSPFQPSLFSSDFQSSDNSDEELAQKTENSGTEKPHIRFGNIGRCISDLIDNLQISRLWVFLDEWSDIPLDIQPFLADLIKRTLLPINKITIKIAAIEQRSAFIAEYNRAIIGMEIGADISADINLDDFMVFGNDEDKSYDFFKKLFFNHLKVIMKEEAKWDRCPLSSDEMIQLCFTTRDTFSELVRSSEGVPRDAINILFNALDLSTSEKISMHSIRTAAKRWYELDKFSSISGNPLAGQLLTWIIDEVIGKKKARAFLVPSNHNSSEINYLFDRRLLHLIKRSVSAQDIPGIRFNVFGIDYGCYVDLIATNRAPAGLLISDDTKGSISIYHPVPKDDMRSIRRSILDLDEFKAFCKAKAIN